MIEIILTTQHSKASHKGCKLYKNKLFYTGSNVTDEENSAYRMYGGTIMLRNNKGLGIPSVRGKKYSIMLVCNC